MHPLYSLGHGNRPLETFLNLLQAFHIKVLADIRSCPKSRRNPHFSQDSLARSLAAVEVDYVWLPDLGGFRKTGLGNASPHVALISPGFRNYADHMDTTAFKEAVKVLLSLASRGPVCFMCAETVPQRCHRLLLADHLLAQDIQVIHILDERRTLLHHLSKPARLEGGRVIYDKLPAPEED